MVGEPLGRVWRPGSCQSQLSMDVPCGLCQHAPWLGSSRLDLWTQHSPGRWSGPPPFLWAFPTHPALQTLLSQEQGEWASQGESVRGAMTLTKSSLVASSYDPPNTPPYFLDRAVSVFTLRNVCVCNIFCLFKKCIYIQCYVIFGLYIMHNYCP